MSVAYTPLPQQLRADAATVLAEALMVEPGFAYIFLDTDDRREALSAIARAIIGTATRANTCWAAIENGAVVGVAVWAAPGAYPPSRLEQIRQLPSIVRLLRLGISTARRVQELDTRAHAYFPQEPVWYLPALGVAPSMQGRGIGTGLIRYSLAQIGDHACYLETGTEANVRLYQRFGFAVVNPAAQLTPEGGPTHWTMLRPAP